VATPDGSHAVRLAEVDGRLRGPIWSPDGRYIAAHLETGSSNYSNAISVYRLLPGLSGAEEIQRIKLPKISLHMIAGWTKANELGVFMQMMEDPAIYTVQVDGGKAVRVSPVDEWPYFPRWSKDGERIYYRAMDKKEETWIFHVPASGGNPEKVPVHFEFDGRLWYGSGLNISPDGSMMAAIACKEPFEPEENHDLWTIPLDGGRPTRLTFDETVEAHTCWSSDGRTIFFTDRPNTSKNEKTHVIYAIPAGGGEPRQISSEADTISGLSMTCSPDGKHIAFFSGNTAKIIPVEGGPSKILVADIHSDDSYNQLEYSPDGSKIAYSSEGRIWITSLDDGETQELRTGLPEKARQSDFSWSPDGQKIAFLSSIGGNPEFWLISDFLPSDKD